MTKRIYRSIVLVALTVLLASILLIMGAVHSYFTGVQFDQLRVETALAAHAVENEGLGYFDRLDDTMDCRITWIDTDGTVLYDNRSDSGTMENHLERQEVIDALETGYGESSRFSATLLEQYIYAAERLPDGTVLRLSVSRRSVLDLVLGMLEPILLVAAAALLLSLSLAKRLSRNIVQPLNTLNLQEPLSNRGYAEIQPLLSRLDSQQEQLRIQARELRQKQKEFNTVTYALNEGLVLLSSSGTILSLNPAAARLLEVTPNCVGADFAVANRNAGIAALAEQALNGQKGEQVLQLTSGQFLAVASPVRSGGVISGVVLLLFDVTQQRESESLRREFTANVSHELKTPLHAISGYAELLKSGIVQPYDVPRFSEKIYAEAQRMIRLVEDTLRLSRLDEGAEEMRWEEADLYVLAQQTCQKLSGPAELAGVALRLQGVHATIRGVPQLLSGILFNLIDNAVKYNHRGGNVDITIDNTPDAVRLTVADTGIGIPPEHRERIFERFYRVDKSHSKEVGGTGLGLSIVKHAAELHKAKISLDSTEGKGTVVTVRFPK
ncbi:MAG: PAS domain-containing sensor histidine kinase [Oscillospiraceae bacterium]|nr:PAS domain-containing sensor histidine kinase [Oscillospiraceae bacterium]